MLHCIVSVTPAHDIVYYDITPSTATVVLACL